MGALTQEQGLQAVVTVHSFGQVFLQVSRTLAESLFPEVPMWVAFFADSQVPVLAALMKKAAT